MTVQIGFPSWTILTVIVLGGCGGQGESERQIEAPGTHGSEIAFRLPERDLIPEGICYDPVGDNFFLGSIRKHKILRISMDGSVTEFVSPRTGGLWSVIGMRVDVERRVLWANSDQGTEIDTSAPDSPKQTGIYKFDAENGSLIKRYLVDKESTDHLFNDVAIASDGTVYITSFSGGKIYRIESQVDELEEFVSMPDTVWTNGIDITPDGRFLFVVGDERIFRIVIASRETLELSVPEHEFVGYGDGLYMYGQSLVAITGWMVDEVPVRRVLRLHLSAEMDAIEQVQILEQDHPLFSSPTTGALVGNWFYYIATSHLGKINEDGELAPLDELSDTYILKLQLD